MNKFILIFLLVNISNVIFSQDILQKYVTVKSAQEFYNGNDELLKSEAKAPLYSKILVHDSLFVTLEVRMGNDIIERKYHLSEFICNSQLTKQGWVEYTYGIDKNVQLVLHLSNTDFLILFASVKYTGKGKRYVMFRHTLKKIPVKIL